VRTIGIDFASDPRNTALCEIVWDDASATIVQVTSPVTDDLICELVAAPPAPVFGVDIPFGWPRHFVEFVSAHAAGSASLPASTMRQKRLRATDCFIQERFRKAPLSVSTDKIGIPAMRWAALSREFGIVNRAGDGKFYEVYPAVARIAWGLPGKDNNAAGLEQILARCPIGVTSPGMHDALLQGEHGFDALLCALVTRAASLGLTSLPPPELLADAEREGWIHVPQSGSLERLIRACKR